MIARWVLTANVFLLTFNVTLCVLNGLLLWRSRKARNKLTEAREDLHKTMDEISATLLELKRQKRVDTRASLHQGAPTALEQGPQWRG